MKTLLRVYIWFTITAALLGLYMTLSVIVGQNWLYVSLSFLFNIFTLVFFIAVGKNLNNFLLKHKQLYTVGLWIYIAFNVFSLFSLLLPLIRDDQLSELHHALIWMVLGFRVLFGIILPLWALRVGRRLSDQLLAERSIQDSSVVDVPQYKVYASFALSVLFVTISVFLLFGFRLWASDSLFDVAKYVGGSILGFTYQSWSVLSGLGGCSDYGCFLRGVYSHGGVVNIILTFAPLVFLFLWGFLYLVLKGFGSNTKIQRCLASARLITALLVTSLAILGIAGGVNQWQRINSDKKFDKAYSLQGSPSVDALRLWYQDYKSNYAIVSADIYGAHKQIVYPLEKFAPITTVMSISPSGHYIVGSAFSYKNLLVTRLRDGKSIDITTPLLTNNDSIFSWSWSWSPNEEWLIGSHTDSDYAPRDCAWLVVNMKTGIVQGAHKGCFRLLGWSTAGDKIYAQPYPDYPKEDLSSIQMAAPDKAFGSIAVADLAVSTTTSLSGLFHPLPGLAICQGGVAVLNNIYCSSLVEHADAKIKEKYNSEIRELGSSYRPARIFEQSVAQRKTTDLRVLNDYAVYQPKGIINLGTEYIVVDQVDILPPVLIEIKTGKRLEIGADSPLMTSGGLLGVIVAPSSNQKTKELPDSEHWQVFKLKEPLNNTPSLEGGNMAQEELVQSELTPAEQSTVQSWSVYKSKFGYSFKYPKGWLVRAFSPKQPVSKGEDVFIYRPLNPGEDLGTNSDDYFGDIIGNGSGFILTALDHDESTNQVKTIDQINKDKSLIKPQTLFIESREASLVIQEGIIIGAWSDDKLRFNYSMQSGMYRGDTKRQYEDYDIAQLIMKTFKGPDTSRVYLPRR